MSILIKAMEMPNKKNGAVVIIYPDGKVCYENGEQYTAVPVPPHGRLIDADAFEEFVRKDWDRNDHWIADVVYSRPTIIEAEEKK